MQIVYEVKNQRCIFNYNSHLICALYHKKYFIRKILLYLHGELQMIIKNLNIKNPLYFC